MRVGILGAGSIAGKMADTIAHIPDVENYAVASRDLKKAEEFAKIHGISKAYGSYEELLSDSSVDLIYIALPHSHHYEWTLEAFNHGRNVLCEKAFAVNAGQAEEMIQIARDKNLLLAEAIWTRYMPSRTIIDEIIKSGIIGELKSVCANLGYKINHVKRLTDPALAGGSLLDLTVYPLNFASMVWGDDYTRMEAFCAYTDTGVDGQDTVSLFYPDGRTASLFTTIYSATDRRGMIYGTNGYIEVININNPEKIIVFVNSNNRPVLYKEYSIPEQISGYEYEVLSCKKAMEEGKCECPEMPHEETIRIMKQMDEIRKKFGIVYPCE